MRRALAALALIGTLGLALAGCDDATGTPSTATATVAGCGHCNPNTDNFADPGSPTPGTTIDGIPCGGSEVLTYHVHAHLGVLVNGAPQTVPAGIGIGVANGQCFAWLHTHDASGVIHIEAPASQAFTLGQLFDIWGLPFNATVAGPAKGPVIVYLNGVRWTGDPRQVPLTAHALIQVDVGRDAAPLPFTFEGGL